MTAAINYLNADKQARYNELLAGFAELDDKGMEELTKLKKELVTNKTKRGDNVTKVTTQIKDLNLTISELFGSGAALAETLRAEGVTITELFSREEISDAAHMLGLVATAGKKTATTRAAAAVRPSDANEILLTKAPEGGKGRSFEYRQGRVFEHASETVKTPWVVQPKAFPKSLLENGQTEAALLKIATETGKTYFATEEGKAELAKLVEVAKDAKKKLDEKAAKDAAPAAAAATAGEPATA
ncbi:hypothetical protein [Burkholderia contaminans]|uniref:hypothetical protein n=1 Tax=Burkholderia contaminans TaxID=488447 RepID=UPI00158F29BE|nr:hypothetical protein [Burkholderia contaminans]